MVVSRHPVSLKCHLIRVVEKASFVKCLATEDHHPDRSLSQPLPLLYPPQCRCFFKSPEKRCWGAYSLMYAPRTTPPKSGRKCDSVAATGLYSLLERLLGTGVPPALPSLKVGGWICHLPRRGSLPSGKGMYGSCVIQRRFG